MEARIWFITKAAAPAAAAAGNRYPRATEPPSGPTRIHAGYISLGLHLIRSGHADAASPGCWRIGRRRGRRPSSIRCPPLAGHLELTFLNSAPRRHGPLLDPCVVYAVELLMVSVDAALTPSDALRGRGSSESRLASVCEPITGFDVPSPITLVRPQQFTSGPMDARAYLPRSGDGNCNLHYL